MKITDSDKQRALEEFLKKGVIKKLPPDPRLEARNGYELASDFGASKVGAATNLYKRDQRFKNKTELNITRLNITERNLTQPTKLI